MSEYNPQKLREIRTRLNLKQEQMAQQAGLSQRDISLLENGKKEFIPTRYIRFLNSVGIDLNWLFSEDFHDYPPDGYQNRKFKTISHGDSQMFFDNQDKKLTSCSVPIIGRKKLSDYPHERENEAFLAELPKIYLPPDDLPQVPTRCFQLEDESMANTLLPFDYIVGQKVEDWEERLRPAFVYIWITNHDVLVRRFMEDQTESLLLGCDHKNYPDLNLIKSKIREVWQVRGRLSFQVPANQNEIRNQFDQIKANLENIHQNLNHN